MKYTKINPNTFKELQLNAGVLLTEFDPISGTISEASIFGATSGGIAFAATPTLKDFGEDIDNCPKGTKELAKIEKWEVTLGGTFATINADVAKSLIAAADVSETKITPRNDLKTTDFSDIWWVGDYSEENGDTNGGFMAIHLMNALSTGGLALQTTDKEKGKFAFSYKAHYSIKEQTKVPFEIYIKTGTPEL